MPKMQKSESAKASVGTLEDDMPVVYKTKSLDGTKPNTNFKTNPKITLILTLFSSFMLFSSTVP